MGKAVLEKSACKLGAGERVGVPVVLLAAGRVEAARRAPNNGMKKMVLDFNHWAGVIFFSSEGFLRFFIQ